MFSALTRVCSASVNHLQLEKMDFDELNDEQRAKIKRKEEIKNEISRLTKLIDKQEYV